MLPLRQSGSSLGPARASRHLAAAAPALPLTVGSHAHVAVIATALGGVVVDDVEPRPVVRLVLGVDGAVGAGPLRDGILAEIPLVVLGERELVAWSWADQSFEVVLVLEVLWVGSLLPLSIGCEVASLGRRGLLDLATDFGGLVVAVGVICWEVAAGVLYVGNSSV